MVDTAPPTRAPRWSTPRWLRLTAIVLLVGFCLAVGVITFWPGPPDPDGQRALQAFLTRAHRSGRLPLWVTFGKIEFGANIVMFVPIGFFGALALPRLRWLIVPAAVVGSVCIEWLQAARLPDRFGTVRDVVANGIGALVGFLLAAAVLSMLMRRDRRHDVVAPAIRQAG